MLSRQAFKLMSKNKDDIDFVAMDVKKLKLFAKKNSIDLKQLLKDIKADGNQIDTEEILREHIVTIVESGVGESSSEI